MVILHMLPQGIHWYFAIRNMSPYGWYSHFISPRYIFGVIFPYNIPLIVGFILLYPHMVDMPFHLEIMFQTEIRAHLCASMNVYDRRLP
jgi:hypothetical protein